MVYTKPQTKVSMSAKKLYIIRNEAKNQQHPFHVLGLSKLPLFMAAFVGGLAISVIAKLQNISNLEKYLTVGRGILQPLFSLPLSFSVDIPDESVDNRIVLFLILILLTLWGWGRELVNEATHQGFHTSNVVQGLKYGMLLFLLSEAMLFFPFF